MRIGVVCEGITDYFAIRAFFGHALKQHNILSDFMHLRSTIDVTATMGGWGNVLKWLEENDPQTRIVDWIDGGLFGDTQVHPPLDFLIFHLDADILDDESFQVYVFKKFGFNVTIALEPSERALQLEMILKLAWRNDELSNMDKKIHVAAPAVESTETWCIAAFTRKSENFELLRGQALIDRFMTVLEMSERGTAKTSYGKISKRKNRREKFCDIYATFSYRVMEGCYHFKKTLNYLLSSGGQ